MSVKILLADDSVTIQKVIGIIFSGDEYSLTIVDNGKAAVEKALETTPDILLIDALMPGMSGYEVCERIRSIPALSAKPILLLTGSFEPFDETKARNCGADDFIAKPFESQLIISKVKELCELAASRAFAAPQVEQPHEAQPFAAPELETFAAFEPQSFAAPEAPPVAVQESAPPSDIWTAFTPTEPAPEPILTVVEEIAPDASATQSGEPAESPWAPLDELGHSFADGSAPEAPAESFAAPEQAAELSFGEISFGETFEPAQLETEEEAFQTEEPLQPIFAEPEESAELFVAPPEEAAAPTATAPPQETAAPPALSEEQLKAAISALSKDVIERIVWEVVPDLAETLIKDAIRKIREGQL